MPFVPIIGSQRPYRLPRHTRIARHYGHHRKLDYETIQRGQVMSIPLLLIVLMTVRMAPFIAILSGERVEFVCEAADNAFGGFLGPGAGDSEDGDVLLVFEAAIQLGPFVVFGYFAEERLLGGRSPEDLGSGVRSGCNEVLEGASGWEGVVS